MSYRIGIYAHSHGAGHSAYAQQLAQLDPLQFVVYTSSDYNFTPEIQVERLTSENPTGEELTIQQVTSAPYLHYNPLGNPSILKRSGQLLNSLTNNAISILLVDVSVEIAMLARVASSPYAYCKMLGNRNDPGHLTAYDGALFLYAFYPKELESDKTPQWVVNKTIYLGFVTAPQPTTHVKTSVEQPQNILVIQGKGGNSFSMDSLNKLEQQFPTAKITLIGEYTDVQSTSQTTVEGFVNQPLRYIKTADLIISACGSNTVSLLLNMNVKFIALPEVRPYDEQLEFARQLEKNNLAVILKDNDFARAFVKLRELPACTIKAINTNHARSFVETLVKYGVHTFKNFNVFQSYTL